MIVKILSKRGKEEENFFNIFVNFASTKYKAEIVNIAGHDNEYLNNLITSRDDYIKRINKEIKYRNEIYFDNFKESSREDQIKKLLENKYVESVQFNDKEMQIITKPLKMWIWNIGQYIIKYNKSSVAPEIERIGHSYYDSMIIPYLESELIERHYLNHPHVSQMRACLGDARELILLFWNDYNEGFNYCIQYLLTYYRDGAYAPLPFFLAYLGYVNDANILIKHNKDIAFYNRGKFYKDSRKTRSGITLGEEIKKGTLREWGFNGKIATKKEMEDFILGSRHYKKAQAMNEGIRYKSRLRRDMKDHENQEGIRRYCYNCSEGLMNGTTVELRVFCPDCLEELTDSCEHCNKTYLNQNLDFSEILNKTVCRNCYKTLTAICGKCENRFIREGMHTQIIDDKIIYLCEKCFIEQESQKVKIIKIIEKEEEEEEEEELLFDDEEEEELFDDEEENQ